VYGRVLRIDEEAEPNYLGRERAGVRDIFERGRRQG
jgi:hypothetical protein